MKKLLRLSDAADYLGISAATLHRWRSAGLVPAYRSRAHGGRFYWDRDQLDDIKQQMLMDGCHEDAKALANPLA